MGALFTSRLSADLLARLPKVDNINMNDITPNFVQHLEEPARSIITSSYSDALVPAVPLHRAASAGGRRHYGLAEGKSARHQRQPHRPPQRRRSVEPGGGHVQLAPRICRGDSAPFLGNPDKLLGVPCAFADGQGFCQTGLDQFFGFSNGFEPLDKMHLARQLLVVGGILL